MHFGEVIDTKPLLDQVRQKRMDEVAARIYITQSIQDKVQELQKLSGYS